MVYTVSVTSQGQLTIPKPLRVKYGLDKQRKVVVKEEDDQIVIKPAPDFFSLMGSVKPRKKSEDWQAVDKAVADAWIEDESKLVEDNE